MCKLIYAMTSFEFVVCMELRLNEKVSTIKLNIKT